MILTYLMLAVALSLSAIAAFYSIVGLTAIFAAATIPIIIMGSVLEIAKLVVTVWLHEYWRNVKWVMRAYLVPAVGVLMLITSMGIFGFLSKAHMDQSLVSGDVMSRIAIYDEKIKTAKENIDANRRALKQMDEAVDQVMGRSTTETGAERSVQIRRQQGPERQRLIREIEAEQKKISQLNEERAPIAAEVRKVEAEVGPIKYIAALIYGDNPDANLLERAVRWVIIILVFVFDPLAVMMLLAFTESRQWELKKKQLALENENGTNNVNDATDAPNMVGLDAVNRPEPQPPITVVVPEVGPNISSLIHTETSDENKEPRVVEAAINPWPFPAESKVESHSQDIAVQVAATTSIAEEDDEKIDDADDTEPHIDREVLREAKSAWKLDNPNSTLKEQRRLFELGKIDRLPWMDYLPKETNNSFGTALPAEGNKGDLFVLTRTMPTELYKHNGVAWIRVDKQGTNQYSYNGAYIDYLIAKISEGAYDPEMLTDSEREQIELRIKAS